MNLLEEMVSVKEACRLMGRSRHWLIRKRAAKGLQTFRGTDGRKRLYRRADIVRLMRPQAEPIQYPVDVRE